MVMVFILMVMVVGKEREVMEKFFVMFEVKEVYVVYGEYDFVVKVEIEMFKDFD